MEDPHELLLHLRIVNGAGNLHPTVEVPGHKVRRGDVYLGIRSPAEAVDPPVLQVTAHNAGDVDIFRVGGDSRPQAADAPEDHLDLNTGAGGLCQLVHDLTLGHGVGLDADIPLGALGHLLLNEGEELCLDAGGGHQQVLVAAGQVAHQHVLEEHGAIQTDGLAGGHEAQVGIHGVGLFVVVAGADLGDIAELVPFAQGDETDLAVALVALQAIDHPAAGVLQ